MNWEVFFRSNVFHFSDAGSAYYRVGFASPLVMTNVKTKVAALSAWPRIVRFSDSLALGSKWVGEPD